MSGISHLGDRKLTVSNVGVSIHDAPDQTGFVAHHQTELAAAVALCVKCLFTQEFFTTVMADLGLDPTQACKLDIRITEGQIQIGLAGKVTARPDRGNLLGDAIFTAAILRQQHLTTCHHQTSQHLPYASVANSNYKPIFVSSAHNPSAVSESLAQLQLESTTDNTLITFEEVGGLYELSATIDGLDQRDRTRSPLHGKAAPADATPSQTAHVALRRPRRKERTILLQAAQGS